METVPDKNLIKCILSAENISEQSEMKGLFRALSTLHTKAFKSVGESGLSASALADLMAGNTSRLYFLKRGEEFAGFAIVRTVLDEAELLTIAVLPDKQNSGVGACLLKFIVEDMALFGAARFFLEVRSDNAAALKLYARFGFQQTGRRSNYYHLLDGSVVDAVTQTLVI